MIKTKLFQGFAIIVALFSVLSALIGIHLVQTRVVDEAQNRVRLNLAGAWSVYNSRLDNVATVLDLVALKESLIVACENQEWDDLAVKGRLERLRVQFDLDFLGVVSPEGEVVIRARAPFNTSDYKLSDLMVGKALRGESVSGTVLFDAGILRAEGAGLAEQATLEIEDTPKARKTDKNLETRGMAMMAASPVRRTDSVIGAVYGGVLVNRNHALIDKIHNSLFKDEKYKGSQVGTATIFLHDCRIATTVRLPNGNRALGTRVSKEVADRVLDNGLAWIGEAFVVNETYLSAYEPIFDFGGQIIGILYVGVLKQPFDDYMRNVILRYGYLTLFALSISLVIAFVLAGRLSEPMHRLVEAANKMSNEEVPDDVSEEHACSETARLIRAFNKMKNMLVDREAKLREVNRNYMETIGFVSHELKSPLASMLNYVYLLRRQMMGPVNEKQTKALNTIDKDIKRIVEMVRHYLSLSRIENEEFSPVLAKVDVTDDILEPLLDSAHGDLESSGMRVENKLDKNTFLNADVNMVREVFDNLLSNAIKYGKEQGVITISSVSKEDMIEFTFRNEGSGIPDDQINMIFDKFSRLSGTDIVRKRKGSGLGLFITRNIIVAHGGDIFARSSPGEWIEFVFTFPAYTDKS